VKVNYRCGRCDNSFAAVVGSDVLVLMTGFLPATWGGGDLRTVLRHETRSVLCRDCRAEYFKWKGRSGS
jgi:hypothetical protein